MKSNKTLLNELDFLPHKAIDAFAKSYSMSFPELRLTDSALIDFLNRKYDECDVLEIQHMRKSNEDVSTRVKLTQRTLLTHLNTNEWSYTTKQSTSIIYKKDVDLSQYSLDIY